MAGALLLVATVPSGLSPWVAGVTLPVFAMLGFVLTRLVWPRLQSWKPRSRAWIPASILLSTIVVSAASDRVNLLMFPFCVGLLCALVWERTRGVSERSRQG